MRMRVFRSAVAYLRQAMGVEAVRAKRFRWALLPVGMLSLYPAFAQEAISYTYDARGRLVQVAHSGSATDGITASYNYDPADNRSNVSVVTSSAPRFSINDVNASEGAALAFIVTRTGSTAAIATVKYATANGTATAGSDYTAAALTTLTFAVGEAAKSVNIATIDDSLVESTETVVVNLSSASSGATIARTQGVGAIIDNDTCAGVTFTLASNAAVTEGATSVFTATKAGATSSSCSVGYATANGTAVSPGDYTAASGTLTFTPSQSSKTVSVTTIDDSAVESAETFTMTLSAPANNATLGVPSMATATINDNDAGGPPTFTINDAGGNEGNTITFTVTKTGSTTSSFSVNYATAGGTATSGTDFVAKSGTLTFAATDVTKTIAVSTIQDSLAEDDETFFVNLSGATAGSTISDAQGAGVIVDDELMCAASANTTSSSSTEESDTVATDPAGDSTSLMVLPPPTC